MAAATIATTNSPVKTSVNENQYAKSTPKEDEGVLELTSSFIAALHDDRLANSCFVICVCPLLLIYVINHSPQ